MTAPPAAPAHATEVAREGSRVYIDPVDNARLPSVTTIISATTAKFGLTDWSAKLAAEFAIDHEEAWKTLLTHVGRDAAVDLIKEASDRYRDAAGVRGSFVHGVVEALVLDQPMPLIEGEAEIAMLDQFLDWYTHYDVTFFMAELTVANRTLGYAGTLDGGVILGAASNRRLLIDVKTGKNVYPAEAGPQLTAYRHAEEVWLPIGVKADMPEVDGCATLHLRTDGWEFIELKAEADAWADWQNAVAKYYSARALSGKKSVIGRVRRDNDPWYIGDFPALSRYASTFADCGLTTLEQACDLNKTTIMSWPGVGPKAFDALVSAMGSVGLAVKVF